MESAEKELIDEFVVESQEGLADVESQLLAIEATGADVDTNQVNAVFRTMHSIKGAAGFLGLDRIGALAHGLEEVLDDLRNQELVPTSELVTTVLRAADFMKDLIDAVENSNSVDVSEHVTELQRIRGKSGDGGGAAAAPAEPEAPAAAEATPAPTEDSPISEAVGEFLVECYENLDQMERELVTLEQDPTAETLIHNIFRTVHTVKGGAGFLGLQALERLAHAAEDILGQIRAGERELTMDANTALLAAVDGIRAALKLVESSGSDAGYHPDAAIKKLQQADQPAEAEAAPEPEAAPAAKDSKKAAAAPADSSAPGASDSTIRVDVSLLDALMTRVGELVLARNQVLQYTSGLDDATFTGTAQRLNLITTELQEGVMKTRMQPIGNVWAKFPRVVRDLSSQLGKHVRIEMEGKNTELDKTIVEAIKDPLTHLIRNSVDHGIEMPDDRKAAGKPSEGRLVLRAYHEGGQVNIEIIDDGAGLNIDRIREKAIERGLVKADQAHKMSDREAAQLILLPGFSTAAQVTSVSGRGVGMDVVKTNIERIGGTIDLKTKPGEGTTVKIKIPLTLAIIPALIVTNGGDRYAIPQVSLLELVRLEGEQAERSIEYVHGAPVYRLRGKLLPLVYLSELMKQGDDKSETDKKAVNIVVLRADDRQFGLVVDRVNDSEEIVVKPLGKQLKRIPVYAGTTIMGDGAVALILDISGLARQAHVVSQAHERSMSDAPAVEHAKGGTWQTLLVVEIGKDRRFALPSVTVARLEKIPRDKLEMADGCEVVQYRGDVMPIVHLSSSLGVTPGDLDADEPLQVLVYYTDDGRNVGLVVDRVIDIVETTVEIKRGSKTDRLLGTAVIQQHVTDLLNLPAIIRDSGVDMSEPAGTVS